MSNLLQGYVWEVGPADPIDAQVLGILASHCDDDGTNCFPSVERVARIARRSQRTVERAIASLEADEWLLVRRGGGRGVVSEYEMNVPKLAILMHAKLSVETPRRGYKRRQPVALSKKQKGDSHDTKRRQPRQEKATPTTQKGDSHDNPPDPLLGRLVIDSSVTHHETQIIPPTPLCKGGENETKLALAKGRSAEVLFTGVCSDLDAYLLSTRPMKGIAASGAEDWRRFHFRNLAVVGCRIEGDLGFARRVLTISSPDPPATRQGLAKYKPTWDRLLRKWYGRSVELEVIFPGHA